MGRGLRPRCVALARSRTADHPVVAARSSVLGVLSEPPRAADRGLAVPSATASMSKACSASTPAASASRTIVGDGRPTEPASADPSATPGRSRPTARPASSSRTRSIRPRITGSCSTHRIAVPSRASSSSSAPTSAVPAGSSWAVGSSRTSTFVPIATMLAMATRCCSPPDRANGSRSARWAMPSRLRIASIRSSISARATPRFSRPNASSSRTVCFDAESWLAGVENTIPTLPSRAPASGGRGGRRRRWSTSPLTVARTTRGMKPRGQERERRLARARPPRHADSLAWLDGQVDVREAGLAPARIADAGPDRGGWSPSVDAVAEPARHGRPRPPATHGQDAGRVGATRSAGGSATHPIGGPARPRPETARLQRERPLAHVDQRAEQDRPDERDERAQPADERALDPAGRAPAGPRGSTRRGACIRGTIWTADRITNAIRWLAPRATSDSSRSSASVVNRKSTEARNATRSRPAEISPNVRPSRRDRERPERHAVDRSRPGRRGR